MLWVKMHPFTTANPTLKNYDPALLREESWLLTITGAWAQTICLTCFRFHIQLFLSGTLDVITRFHNTRNSHFMFSSKWTEFWSKQKSEMPLVTVEEFSKVLASVQLWFCRSIGIHLCVTAHWALLLQYALHLHPFVFSHGRFLWRPTLLCRSPGYPCTPSHTPVGTR